MTKPLISIKNVSKKYINKNFKGQKHETLAVNDVSFEIYKGETLGLVGESGSGKSTLGKIILGFEQQSNGEVVLSDTIKRLNRQIIFQDPYSALNAKMRAIDIVKEAIWQEDSQIANQKAIDMLNVVGIQGDDIYKLPHQFSGGQRQRIGIARAVVSRPDFILCDEPTSALDVSIQTQILELLNQLKDELQLSYLFISHNLSVVEHISDRIAVMYHGQLVELAPTKSLFDNPQHHYTKKLLLAQLTINPLKAKERLKHIEKINDIVLSNQFEWLEVLPNHYVRKDIM